MATEPWRKRGFVPDSDDEEEFESLEVEDKPSDVLPDADDDVDLEYLPLPPKNSQTDSKTAEDERKENHSTVPIHSEGTRKGSVELLSTPVGRFENSTRLGTQIAPSANETSGTSTPEDTTPKPRRSRKKYGRTSSGATRKSNIEIQVPSPSRNKDDSIWDITSSPPEQKSSARKLRRDPSSKSSTPSKLSQNLSNIRITKNHDQKRKPDIISRSSSPDELNVIGDGNESIVSNGRNIVDVARPGSQSEELSNGMSKSFNRELNMEIENALEAPNPVNLTEEAPMDHRDGEQAVIEYGNPQEMSDNDSPLSSPPASLHSPEDSGPIYSLDAPSNGLDQPDLIELDIPEEILREATQPARRSFRERNAIQLHPYALEMARYQLQMRSRGVKPIRMTEEEKRKREAEAAGESQEQDSFNPVPGSSPPPEEFLREARREHHPGGTDELGDQQRSPLRRTHSSKRRKKSNPRSRVSSGGHRLKRREVIHNQTPPANRLGPSVYDIPSSPPHSGSLPSAKKPAHDPNVFQFPPGFTPPQTTLEDGNSKTPTPAVDENNEDDLPGSVAGSIEAERRNGVDSDDESNDSEVSHLSDEETPEERAIRLMQRRTRGVLPASWVRVNAPQSSIDRQKENQRNRINALQRADGKGVAKKISRKPDQSGNTGSGQRPVLLDFSESDDSEDTDVQIQTPTNHNSDNDELNTNVSRQPFGLPNPFSDDDDENMEDNRIDNMFPPASTSRNHSTHPERRKSLKRPKPKDTLAQRERNAKRARFKTQTRITDSAQVRRTKPSAKSSSKSSSKSTKRPSSRGQRRSSANSPPRLGVLDAPDVANRPRQEQPQFLRVAARRARSRQDRSRQSPTRKFIQLGSRDDTADANESLREWRGGSIRPAKISRPKPQRKKRQPLSNLANGIHRAAATAQNSRTPRYQAPAREQEAMDLDSDQEVQQENVPADGDMPSNAMTTNINADEPRPRRQERRGNEWIIHRNQGITSLKRTAPRPAAMHVAGLDSPSTSTAMFSQTLSRLNRDFRTRQSSQGFRPSITLDRYISDKGPTAITPQNLASSSAVPSPVGRDVSQANRPQKSHASKNKKAAPRRIDQSNEDIRQAFSRERSVIASQGAQIPNFTRTDTSRMHFSTGGLFNWQPSYSLDFGIVPLRSGTFFHESTFIGSHDFQNSLEIMKRDMDVDAGISNVHLRDQNFHWSNWTEAVSSQLGLVFREMCLDIEQNVICPPERASASLLLSSALVFRSVIRYVTRDLSFIDPIDRKGFVDRAMKMAWNLQDSIRPFLAGEHNKAGLIRLSSYNMVFANQIRQVASHDTVSHEVAEDSLNLTKATIRDTFALSMCSTGISELYELSIESDKNIGGLPIREQLPFATAIVMIKQLLDSSDVFHGILGEIELETCDNLVRNQKDVIILESAWRNLFAVLPVNDFDQDGVVSGNSRFNHTHDHWVLVKRLLSPALEAFDLNSASPMSYNSYCRILFHRCHNLINSWGWKECRLILDALYDFFAARLLHNMKHEHVRGSPSFLDELDKKPSLDVRPGDPCFHILLKIVASGLRILSKRYDKKKMRNFAWRLLPNHGRVYPKEQPLNTEDLEALRNHHDLLCTLYWAVPDGCRPRVETIRNLIHPAASHRETIDINIRSWTRLVRFKLSTDEDISGLDVFADWHAFFVTELRLQHAHARKEIENQTKDDKWTPKHEIEAIISKNQRQIESLLKMAMAGLKNAIEQAPSLDHAYRLIMKAPFDSLLGMFNTKTARVNAVVSDTLRVIMTYNNKDIISTPAASDVRTSNAPVEEDSQEFEDIGDWAEIEAVLGQQKLPSEAIEHVQKVLRPAVFQTVSNCFGEDNCPEDFILNDVVQCWTSVANVLVRHGLQRWDNYLDPYGDESWTRLRDTVQTRKFAPLFLATCVDKDARVVSDCRILVMGMWMSSLAERTSMLKFQNRLTEALLNGAPNDPLVQNLPFTKTKHENRYEITLSELTQRQVSLISSVLSNMRDHVLQMELHQSPELSVTKDDYSDILQQFMKAMQKNYRETGNGDPEAARGAYIPFVHQIIRFLQELTSDIRPVDPFFTDPALFPLPSSDPRYIVAKLKRYEPKLSAHKEVQALTMFIQSISERAVIDQQQSVLIDQLHKATNDTFEDGAMERPTLRGVLLQSVFPAYIECSFHNPASWILSRPIILTTSVAFDNLLFNINASSKACRSSAMIMIDAIFKASYRALRPLSNRPRRFQDPVVISMLTVFVELFSSSLVVIDYIDRLADEAEGLISYIQWFCDFIRAAAQRLEPLDSSPEDDMPPLASPSEHSLPPAIVRSVPQYLANARRTAFEDYQPYLRNWTLHQSKYYYSRAGHDARQVDLEPEVAALVENATAARSAFNDAVVMFTDRVSRLDLLP